MKRVLVVFHSQSGNTERLAKAVERGARRCEAVSVEIKRAFDTRLDDLLSCDAIVFATAEYNGYMSGALKDFFDRTYDDAQDKVTHKPYAIVVSAGNDGTFAAQYVQRIARGYKLKQVAEPIIVVGPVTDDALQRCEELGEMIATGVEIGVL